jgi:hypothetical protein
MPEHLHPFLSRYGRGDFYLEYVAPVHIVPSGAMLFDSTIATTLGTSMRPRAVARYLAAPSRRKPWLFSVSRTMCAASDAR